MKSEFPVQFPVEWVSSGNFPEEENSPKDLKNWKNPINLYISKKNHFTCISMGNSFNAQIHAQVSQSIMSAGRFGKDNKMETILVENSLFILIIYES